MIKVSFDFDSTLDKPYVQDYAQSLINRGIDVYVITSRYDELHKHRYLHNPTNEDLYKVAAKYLGCAPTTITANLRGIAKKGLGYIWKRKITQTLNIINYQRIF